MTRVLLVGRNTNDSSFPVTLGAVAANFSLAFVPGWQMTRVFVAWRSANDSRSSRNKFEPGWRILFRDERESFVLLQATNTRVISSIAGECAIFASG